MAAHRNNNDSTVTWNTGHNHIHTYQPAHAAYVHHHDAYQAARVHHHDAYRASRPLPIAATTALHIKVAPDSE
jgi:hypothetical protein